VPNVPLARLYALTTALLVAHEIDSAYWKEWELFRLPGGLPGFLALHVPLVVAVLWGHAQVVRGRRAGAWASLVLAAAGAFAVALHGALLLAGDARFRAAASVAVLAAIAAASLAQGGVSIAALRVGGVSDSRSGTADSSAARAAPTTRGPSRRAP
jgi:uncharacterized protein DUF6713